VKSAQRQSAEEQAKPVQIRAMTILSNLWARWKEFRVDQKINRKPVMSEQWRVAQIRESHFDRNVGN